MSSFGLDEHELRTLVEAVMPGQELDDAATATAFARAAWTVIAEPGDGEAGALIAQRGAVGALDELLRAVAEPRGAQIAPTTLERWSPRVRSIDVQRALRQAALTGVRLLVPPGDRAARWPHGLADLGEHAPAALWFRGDSGLLAATAQPAIALVGARAATGYGEHVAGELASGLVERGVAIISGAAYGIDGMSHRAALATGGSTVAFLAGGADRFYPAGHDELLHRIADRGLIVSEMPCGAAPTKWRFLARNRLIAASCAATVVVEAGARSGSLNTAGHAATLSRPLGAVPGPVTSPASAGCHRLLREYGAVCVTTAEEVAEMLPLAGPLPLFGDDRSSPAEPEPRDSADTVRLLDALSTRTGRTPHEIAAASGLAVGTVLGLLAALELDGRVRGRAGTWVTAPQRR
jgi:DNA processing protein